MLNLDELTEADRIVLRYRLAEGSNSPNAAQFSDVLGYVVQVDSRVIRLRTRGGIVEVERALITRAKRVPPPPVRRPRSSGVAD